MSKSIQYFGYAIVCLLGNATVSDAQPDLSKWQVGVNVGAFIYQGDLTPSQFGSYKTWKPGFGLYVSRIVSPSFILRTNLAFGKLKGDDAKYDQPAWRQQRNFNFTSPVTELSELIVWNIFKNNSNEEGKRFSPYLFAGAGISFVKVNRDYSSFNAAYFGDGEDLPARLQADADHKLPRKLLVLPVGTGVEFYLTPKISLTAETNFRYTRTDYLDGFSQAANPDKNDFYHSHTVGLVYKFGSKNMLGCPVLRQ
ncbi:MAG TPA: DUF6089 family protein [Ferruginibacter sp.]|nr:DUF6089 family protein [Ferruginibacter sp.]